jgi:hypothetical protein
VAAVMAMVSPSHPNPAVIHRTSISLIDSLMKNLPGRFPSPLRRRWAGRQARDWQAAGFFNRPGEKKGGASEHEVQRTKTFGAGLGWRGVQRLPSPRLRQGRPGFGDGASPHRKNRRNRFRSSRLSASRRSILVGHDCGGAGGIDRGIE